MQQEAQIVCADEHESLCRITSSSPARAEARGSILGVDSAKQEVCDATEMIEEKSGSMLLLLLLLLPSCYTDGNATQFSIKAKLKELKNIDAITLNLPFRMQMPFDQWSLMMSIRELCRLQRLEVDQNSCENHGVYIGKAPFLQGLCRDACRGVYICVYIGICPCFLTMLGLSRVGLRQKTVNTTPGPSFCSAQRAHEL